jgi:hypothetical protein
MQFQSKLSKPLAELGQELHGFLAILESHDIKLSDFSLVHHRRVS